MLDGLSDKLVIFREHIRSAGSDRLESAATALTEIFAADGAVVLTATKQGSQLKGPQKTGVLSHSEGNWLAAKLPIRLPVAISDAQRERIPAELSELLSKSGIKSWLAVSSSSGNTAAEIWFQTGYVRMRREDITLLKLAIDELELLLERSGGDFDAAEYNRLVKYGRVSVIKTDRDFNVIGVSGGIIEALGILPEELFRPGAFRSIIAADDFGRISRKIKRLARDPREITEEIRINHAYGGAHWLLVRLYPILSANKELQGWEAIAFDISEKKEAEGALLIQNRRVEALYEVSRALQSVADPVLVVEQGLPALIKATDSAGGMIFFYNSSSDELELAAHAGVSAQYVAGVRDLLTSPSLVRHAIRSKTALLVGDIQSDPRAARRLAEAEGLRATIVAPLMVEDSVLGAVLLSCREADRYSDDDLELIKAAANQIGLVVKQAEYYAAERRQASSFAALYRLSHELSKHYTVREIAEHAFPIIHNEIACKRMWLGIVNDQDTHLIGQAGYGPGVRKKVIEMQIELNESRPFLDRVLAEHVPVIAEIKDGQLCGGLEGIMHRLGARTIVIVPLLAIGKVIGILCLEPLAGSPNSLTRKLPLLGSMANEIGSAITARRFESRIANANKMRMATMLASGVAHNFNNLLQAVMGQASLLELQLDPGSAQQLSARQIVQAANRGAALVKQLLTVSKGDNGERSVLSLNKFIRDSSDFYRSLLGDGVALEVQLSEELPEVWVDQAQMQQVMTNLLVNAREALQRSVTKEVSIKVVPVSLGSSEVDPELPPGKYVRVDVSDSGSGMDSEKQLRCFEPFFSTKDGDNSTGLNFEGAGLGLSSAYSIVKNHEGIISVHSEVGKGATFSIFLPLVAPKSASATPESDIHVKDILILGMPDGVSQMMRRTVEGAGYNAIVTSDEGEARRVMRSDNHSLALLVVAAERRSPSMLRFVRDVRLTRGLFPVLVVTANPSRWRKLVRGLDGLVVTERQQQLRALSEILTEIGKKGLAAKIEVIREPANGAVFTSDKEQDDKKV